MQHEDFLKCMIWYDINMLYRSGKQMELADTILSRVYLPNTSPLQKEVESVNMAEDLQVSAARLEDNRKHTEEDESLQELTKVILYGWPEQKERCHTRSSPFNFNIRDELSFPMV